MHTNAALQSLLTGLNAALKAQVRQDTGLFDPLDDKPSPPDHYGHVCAALALACAGKQHWDTGRLALQAWIDLPPDRLGHLPFNRLALLLLREVLGAEGLVAADAQRIDAGLRRCTLRRRYPSNNWSLLAQTCRLIEARPANKAHECRHLCDLLDRWTTPKGCFIDFPENPGKRFSTPIAYHHKALFLTALACWFHDDEALAQHARRLCDWLVHCWDPAGYAGGFGRSTHSLFGDGCLVAGLILLGIDKTDPQPITALSQRIAKQRRPDGLLWLNPAGHESGKASWDSYMHLSVYNAWAAGVIGAAIALREIRNDDLTSGANDWTAARTGLFHDPNAGLACLRTDDDLVAVVSTHGQPPQSFSQDQVEFRYAGGTIIHLRRGADGLIVAPPVRISRIDLLNQPLIAGQTPIISDGHELYGFDEFETCVFTGDDTTLRITLAGNASALCKSRPRSLAQRVLATIDWRLLGGALGRLSVLSRPRLPSAKCEVVISLGKLEQCPAFVRKVAFQLPARFTLLNAESSIVRKEFPAGLTPSVPEEATKHLDLPSSIPGFVAITGHEHVRP